MAQNSLSWSDARELCKLVDDDHPELSISRQCALLDRALLDLPLIDPLIPADTGSGIDISDHGHDRYRLLRHHAHPAPLRGWCLLDARRHLGGPLDFTSSEASTWGKIVQQASQFVQMLTNCERVYAIAFGEGAHHLHLHLIPRHVDDTRTVAWSVADLYRSVEFGDVPSVSKEEVEEFISKARDTAQNLFHDF